MKKDETFDSGKFCRCGKEMLITLKPSGEVKNIYCPDETCYWNNRLKNRGAAHAGGGTN